MEQILYLGPPGTGKTYKLIDKMKAEMAGGVRPDRIAFCSFTNKAADEARDRAIEAFKFTKDDLPYFRTLHSLAFKQLGLRREDVLQKEDYEKLGEALGLRFAARQDFEEGLPSTAYTGDRYVFLDGFARARCMAPEDAWHLVADDELNWFEFKRFRQTLLEYKKQVGKIDFTDMLEQADKELDIDVAFLDEVQDLSTLQWEFAYKVLSKAKRVYLAGDDDQGIYQWSGADIAKFLSIKVDQQIILDQSRRIPSSVYNLSQSIVNRISHRYPKTFHSKDDAGLVEYHREPDSIDFSMPGSWLILARNSYHLSVFTEVIRSAGIPYLYRGRPSVSPNHIKAIKLWEELRKGKALSLINIRFLMDHMKQGIDYSRDMRTKIVKSQKAELDMKDMQNLGLKRTGIWHESLSGISLDDREYYLSMLRGGENIVREPRIHISTIHSVKGGEADNVVLMTDVTSKTFNTINTNPDAEHRVFYVGATRAKQQLHILEPQTRSHYLL